MAIGKKTLPATKSSNKPEATPAAPKTGKPSADVSASDAVTPSLIIGNFVKS